MNPIIKAALLKIRHPKAGVYVKPMFRYKPHLSRIKSVWYVKQGNRIYIDLI